MTPRDFFYGIGELLFIPLCPVCDMRLQTRLTDKRRNIVFCEACEKKYMESVSNDYCEQCREPLASCRCSPGRMKRQGVPHLIKMFRYQSKELTVPNFLIYTLKKTRSNRALDFCSDELCASIKKLVPNYIEWIITFAPRSAKRKREYGHDQSELLAKAIAKKLKIPYVDCFKRSKEAVIQKGLTNFEREKNMKGSYTVKKGVDLVNKKVFVVDDIVTSGSTMIEAAKKLRRAGAVKVAGVAIAIAYREITREQTYRLKKKYKLAKKRKIKRY